MGASEHVTLLENMSRTIDYSTIHGFFDGHDNGNIYFTAILVGHWARPLDQTVD